MTIRIEQSSETLDVAELLSQSHALKLQIPQISQLLKPGLDGSDLPVALKKSKYFQLSRFMQEASLINSAPTEEHYRRHLFRMRNLLESSVGLNLDIGCGDPAIGAALLSSECHYLGIDPFVTDIAAGKICGAAEDLPFVSESFDTAIFNTSLDHILDYKLALLEARRVLKPTGTLFISTLFWNSSYSLLNDRVHFHHFHEFEILGALETADFSVDSITRYSYKSDAHRYGAYIKCCK